MSILDFDYTIEEQKILPDNKRKDLNKSTVEPISGQVYYKGNILKSFIDALLQGSVQWFYLNVSKSLLQRFINQSQYSISYGVYKGLLNYELEGDRTLNIIRLSLIDPTPSSFIIGARSNSSFVTYANNAQDYIMQGLSGVGNDLLIQYPSSYVGTAKEKFLKNIAVKYATPGINITYSTY